MRNIYETKPWLRSYDREVSPSIEYPHTTFSEYIRHTFNALPSRAALIYMGCEITFECLDILSNKFAGYLRKKGIDEGSVIAVHTPNIPACYIALLGIQKAGCVYSGVNVLLRPDEIKSQLNDSGAAVLITTDTHYDDVAQIIGDTGVETVLIASVNDFLRESSVNKRYEGKFNGKEFGRFMAALDGVSGNPVRQGRAPDDTSLIMYTGGTTGPSKGAVLTHKNIVSHLVQMTHWFNQDIGTYTYLYAFPMYHQAGNFMAMWCYAIGATNILVPEPRNLQFIVSTIKKYRPNAILNVPTIFIDLMKMPEFRDLDFSNVNWFISGAMPFPVENIREFESIVGNGKLVEVVGMTETSPVLTALPYRGLKKPGSVGLPLSDTEIQLIDPENSQPVAQGDAGELVARGPQVFTKGYLNKPEETANVLRDGWIHTGDLCTMDEDGYFQVVDRLKDMVSVSGYKVFTRQIDDLLSEHPDVYMAATIGIPDAGRPGSELVASAIVLKPGREKNEKTREDIINYTRVKVAPYKVPKIIEFVDDIPMTSVGKISKRELRQIIRDKRINN